jgi:hypothetical protein
MQATSEFVSQFLETVDQPYWATEERWPQVWTEDPEDPGFKFYLTAPDPYELLDDVVNLLKISEVDVFYIMTGWMTPIDPDTEETEGERMRVRVILGASPKCTPFVAVERAGGEVEVFEDMGEGMFPDTFHALMADN